MEFSRSAESISLQCSHALDFVFPCRDWQVLRAAMDSQSGELKEQEWYVPIRMVGEEGGGNDTDAGSHVCDSGQN